MFLNTIESYIGIRKIHLRMPNHIKSNLMHSILMHYSAFFTHKNSHVDLQSKICDRDFGDIVMLVTL